MLGENWDKEVFQEEEGEKKTIEELYYEAQDTLEEYKVPVCHF